MTFGEREQLQIRAVGRGSSPGHVLHPFLLALYTNLAADVAKLGVCAARTQGGGGHWRSYRLYSGVS